jgi:hypothetical protein
VLAQFDRVLAARAHAEVKHLSEVGIGQPSAISAMPTRIRGLSASILTVEWRSTYPGSSPCRHRSEFADNDVDGVGVRFFSSTNGSG